MHVPPNIPRDFAPHTQPGVHPIGLARLAAVFEVWPAAIIRRPRVRTGSLRAAGSAS